MSASLVRDWVGGWVGAKGVGYEMGRTVGSGGSCCGVRWLEGGPACKWRPPGYVLPSLHACAAYLTRRCLPSIVPCRSGTRVGGDA